MLTQCAHCVSSSHSGKQYYRSAGALLQMRRFTTSTAGVLRALNLMRPSGSYSRACSRSRVLIFLLFVNDQVQAFVKSY